MITRSIKIMTFIVLILFLCTGCWDTLDIEDRSIYTINIIDKTDTGFAFHVEIATITSNMSNPAQEHQGGQKPIVIKAEGRTMAETRADLDRIADKTSFLGANQAVLFTQRMAEYGIEEYMYRVRSLNDLRKTEDVAVVQGNPEDFLAIQPENATAVGFAVEYSLENEIEEGHTFHASIEDVLEKLTSTNRAFIVNTLGIKQKQVALVGFSVFDDGKCIGYIPSQDGRGIVCTVHHGINDPTPVFGYVVPYPEGEMTLEVHMTHRNIRPSYTSGQIHFDLEYHYSAEELYPSNRNPITKEVESEISAGLQAQLEEDIWKAINASQKHFGVDFMSFSEPFRISYPDAYEKMDWKQEFPKAEFSVKTVVDSLRCHGFTYNPEKK